MRLLQIAKDILTKKSYDFDRPDVSLYNFHPQIQIIFAMNGLFFNKKNTPIRLIWPFLVAAFAVVFLVFEQIFLFHFLDIADYSRATECFSYTVILGNIPLVFLSLLLNKHALYDIIGKMNEDFLTIRNRGARYRKPFLEGQLYIWQLCCAWYMFELIVGSMYCMAQIVAVCYDSLFVTHDENSQRPLQFVMWFPYDDPYRTPNFEIFLGMELFIVVCVVNTYTVYVYSLLHFLLHYYTIMEMIILDFQVLFDGLEESAALLSRYDERRIEVQQILNKRMENIVNMHLSVFAAVKTVSSVYGLPLVYQVMFTAVAVCLIGYQVAEKLENGTLDLLFCSLGMAAVLQMWIPCYLGTRIRNKAFDVGDAAWECGWHRTSLGLLVRNDIIIVVLRAQQPVTIRFIGLPQINLETFSAIMSKSYSYFNMVRQYSQQ